MAERVSADHPSVRTLRASVERLGATSRPRLQLPPDATEDVPSGVVRLDIGGRRCHAEVREGFDGDGPVIDGAADNARLARSPGEGPNRLAEWVADEGIAFGRSVCVDVVVPGHQYGVRRPGTTTVYELSEPPAPSLLNIAEELDG